MVSVQRRKNDTESLFVGIIKEIVTPPPDLTVSEWADMYRKLSSESSSEPGQWRTSRAPYQKEIMDSVNDSNTEKIIIMSSAQVGKSELLLNTVGYHIDFDPSPIMMLQPTVDLAKSFSKERIAPMLRDSPTLRKKAADDKSRDSGNTVMQKSFTGGYIALVGANAPSGLASRPIRILLADEVDRFPVSAGSEGDPLSLAEKRTNNFPNRKKIFVSTPTIKGASRIEAEFETSTQEHWHLPCPSCREYQPLRWSQIKFDYDDETKEVKSAHHACKYCGTLHDEFEWKAGNGKWVADKPDVKNRGFHLNELVSPWKRWKEIISDFKDAKKKGKESLKVWVNTSLGETWEEQGDGVKSEGLLGRRKEYGCEVPNEVAVLTSGVDVQDNRLEYEIVGWGPGKESWGIEYGVIMGDPGQEFVWKSLDDVILKDYKRQDGNVMKVMSTCVDSGGHHTSSVYDYCKKREYNRVWAIKGVGGTGHSFIKRPNRRDQYGIWLFTIGVDVGKDDIVSRLKAEPTQNGYCHFPIDREKGYDDYYFKGLTAEHRVTRYKNGQPTIKWELKTSSARNEPFDLRNYATAALEILNPNLDAIKEQLENGKPLPVKRRRRKRVLSKGIK
ncbi:phage terminase large subunit family protein [Lentibacillus sp. Marseille-P4043]|uniref:phage terminase large subunit family protein n=1 Tax=Lentibacillus sp. Marseille-P4043 TaxID=2040293 RepID=UPI000D0AD4F5|nr:phage terminase large subunit family protein [Lentibacillus sp. Marseille-P4043]